MGRSFAFRLALLTVLIASPALVAEPVRADKPAQEKAAKPAPDKAAKPAQEKAAPPAVDLSAGILAGETPAGIRIEKALDEQTDLDCDEMPLTDVIDYFKRKHNVEILLDNKALEEAGVATDTPVSRHLKNVSLRSALRIVLRDLDLTFCIRDEVLLFTTTAQSETIFQTRVYPVGDLVGDDVDELLDATSYERLIDTISSSVDMTTWSEVGGAGSIKADGAGSLVISQTQEVHEHVRDLLTALRKTRGLERGRAKEAAAASDPNQLFVAMYRVASHPRPYKVAVTPAPAGGSAFEVSVNEVFRGPMFSPTGGSAIEISVGQPPETPVAAKPKAANGPDMGAMMGDAEKPKPAPGPQSVRVSSEGLADDLARVIPKLIEPESWQANGGQGSIESIGSAVLVRQTRHIQHEVARFLHSVEAQNRRAKMSGGSGMMCGGIGMTPGWRTSGGAGQF